MCAGCQPSNQRYSCQRVPTSCARDNLIGSVNDFNVADLESEHLFEYNSAWTVWHTELQNQRDQIHERNKPICRGMSDYTNCRSGAMGPHFAP